MLLRNKYGEAAGVFASNCMNRARTELRFKHSGFWKLVENFVKLCLTFVFVVTRLWTLF